MEICGNRSWRWVMSDYFMVYFYSKTNQMHKCLKFILFYFAVTLYLFRMVFPSIIWGSRLYIQKQAYVQSWNRDDGRKDRPKHLECYCKVKLNKFETLVHVVGFAIEIYYDARPYERQISWCVWCYTKEDGPYKRFFPLNSKRIFH